MSKDRPGGARVRHLSGIVSLTIIVAVIKPHFVGSAMALRARRVDENGIEN
jgi:hypothetical protein